MKSKHAFAFAGLGLALVAGVASIRSASAGDDDIASVRQLCSSFVDAFNAHDAKGMAKPFAEDADALGPQGTLIEGRTAIEAQFASEHGSTGPLREATLDEVFQLFPVLKERQDSLAGSLSGGQQQMVAIGRGLMAKPRVLLMDEPSLGLSPLIVGEMFKIIQMINERGVAVLLVEQNVNKALEIAHQAYVIEQGRVTASGAPEVLINDPSIREAYLGI